MSQSRELDAWLYGTHVARLAPGPREGAVAMEWTDEARTRWGAGSRVLSHLLPIEARAAGPHPARARVWLEGLLPEGQARGHLAMDVGVDPDDTLAFLSYYGRDTAGAVVLAPAGSDYPERSGRLVPVSPDEIGEMLRRAESYSGPRGDKRDSLTSLAGLEPKITLAQGQDGGWLRCLDGAPSTHILKVSRPEGSVAYDVIDTEAATLELARDVGLTSVDAQVMTYGGVRCIVISRYDRPRRDDGTVGRTHQEDAAQALGLDTADAARKFQHGKRLPSLAAIAEVLRGGFSEPDALLRLVTFNVAVGNTDAHAKNISFLRHPDGTVQLAPAYDTAMHLHAGASAGLSAMDVNGKRSLAELTAEDLVEEGTGWAVPRPRAVRAIGSVLDGLSGALERIDRDTHPGVSVSAWTTVERRVEELSAQLEPHVRALRRRR